MTFSFLKLYGYILEGTILNCSNGVLQCLKVVLNEARFLYNDGTLLTIDYLVDKLIIPSLSKRLHFS